jgi:hypothetical protein
MIQESMQPLLPPSGQQPLVELDDDITPRLLATALVPRQYPVADAGLQVLLNLVNLELFAIHHLGARHDDTLQAVEGILGAEFQHNTHLGLHGGQQQRDLHGDGRVAGLDDVGGEGGVEQADVIGHGAGSVPRRTDHSEQGVDLGAPRRNASYVITDALQEKLPFQLGATGRNEPDVNVRVRLGALEHRNVKIQFNLAPVRHGDGRARGARDVPAMLLLDGLDFGCTAVSKKRNNSR